jgi:ubiquinone/menaquinone biosynthesis C-methylase UbiE
MSNQNQPQNNFIKFIECIDLSEKQVLDIGCAEIRPYSKELLIRSKNYTGLEINDNFLIKARQNIIGYNNATIYKMNAENLLFEDSSYDLIVCNDMLAYTDKKKH